MKDLEPFRRTTGKAEFEAVIPNVCDDVDDSTILREVAFCPFAAGRNSAGPGSSRAKTNNRAIVGTLPGSFAGKKVFLIFSTNFLLAILRPAI